MPYIIHAAVFLVTLWALAGCARAAPQADDPLLASRWLLASFSDGNGNHPIPTDPVPYLEVDHESLWFYSGCNGARASSRVEDGRLVVEMILIRGVGCSAHFNAAEELLDAVANSMGTWSAYSLEGDEMVISHSSGEIRFRRSFPANAAGLRAFPVQLATSDKPAYEEGLLRGRLELTDGCLRIRDAARDMEYSDLIIWPANHAGGFDERAARVWRSGDLLATTGDDLVLSGGRLYEFDPLLDADFFRLATIPDDCLGPYYIVEDVLSLAPSALSTLPDATPRPAATEPRAQPTATTAARHIESSLPSGWTWYESAMAGYRIAHPESWHVSTRSATSGIVHETTFRGADGPGPEVVIDVWQPSDDPAFDLLEWVNANSDATIRVVLDEPLTYNASALGRPAVYYFHADDGQTTNLPTVLFANGLGRFRVTLFAPSPLTEDEWQVFWTMLASFAVDGEEESGITIPMD